MMEKSYLLTVTPTFPEDIDSSIKINFEKRLLLKSTAAWIKTPDNLVLLSDARQFRFEVNPTTLEDGSHSYGEVQGWDSDSPVERGPLFRFPVTVLKPVQLSAGQTSLKYTNLKLKPGEFHRFFVTVPREATWAELRIQGKQFTQRRLVTVAYRQFVKHRSVRETMNDKSFWFIDDPKELMRFSVAQDKTLEVVVGTYWSQDEDTGTVNVKIKFHSIVCRPMDPTGTLSLYPGCAVQSIVSCPLQAERVQYQAYLCGSTKRLMPIASSVTPLGPRDLLPSGKQINRLTNTYTFTEKGTVRLCFPGISDLLYESPIEGPLILVFDENKRLMETCDWNPVAFALPRDAKYTVLVQIRHHETEKLKAFKTLPLVLEKPLPKDKHIQLPLYPKIQNSIVLGAKNFSSAVTLRKGVEHPIIIGPPDLSKLPSSASQGEVFVGYLMCREPAQADAPLPENVPKSGFEFPMGSFPLSYVVSSPPAKSSDSENGFPFDAEQSAEENFKEASKHDRVQYINFLLHKSHLSYAHALLQKSLEEFPDHLPLLKANLDYHIKVAKGSKEVLKEQQAVITAAKAMAKQIDDKEIALFFGVRHEDQKALVSQFMKKKEALIFALSSKANALATIQKSDPNGETKVQLEEAVNELSKWVKLSDEPKYMGLYTLVQALQGNLSIAVKALKKALGASNERALLELEIEWLSQLGWTHWVQLRKTKLSADFPPSFRLF